MQVEGGRKNGLTFSEGLMDGVVPRSKEIDGFITIRTCSSSSSASSSSSSSPSGVNYIEHRVSKMDTLVGVAIKYGVEVADIRRLNGLVTDRQMFAHKSLQIPLPGRHPPSPILSNGSAINGDCREWTPPRRTLNDVLDSFQSIKLKPSQGKVSPAMSTLQGYYGLTPPKRGPAAEGTEMAVYRTGWALNLDDKPMPRVSPVSDPLPARHRKFTSLANGISQENGDVSDFKAAVEVSDNGEAEKSIRRRQKADADQFPRTPELLLDTNGGFLGRKGKSLAPRPKSGSRTDVDMARGNAVPSGDPLIAADGLAAVRKSSSTSNLQESENGSSIWPSSKWSLKSDAIASSILDGLPKPMGIRRNKAALD